MEPVAVSPQSSNASPESPTPLREAPYSLQCLEIFGGNRTVQHALTSPGLDAWIDSRPFTGGRGGDLHYVSLCGFGRVTRFIVADISGHGPDMDELAQWLLKMARRHINLLDQTRFARALNRDFAEKVGDGQFATVLLATYFAPTHHLIVCNAGHPRPLWFSHRAAGWQFLDQATANTGPSIRTERVRYMPPGYERPRAVFRKFSSEPTLCVSPCLTRTNLNPHVAHVPHAVRRFATVLLQSDITHGCIPYIFVHRAWQVLSLPPRSLQSNQSAAHVRFFKERRPHQGLGNQTLPAAVAGPPEALSPDAASGIDPIRCRRFLGGLLRHHYRAAA